MYCLLVGQDKGLLGGKYPTYANIERSPAIRLHFVYLYTDQGSFVKLAIECAVV